MLLNKFAPRSILARLGYGIEQLQSVTQLRVLIIGLLDSPLLDDYLSAFESVPGISVFVASHIESATDLACLSSTDKLTLPLRLSPDKPDLILVNVQSPDYAFQIEQLRRTGFDAPILPLYVDSSGEFNNEKNIAGLVFPLCEPSLLYKENYAPQEIFKKALEIVWLMRVMTWLDRNEAAFERVLRKYRSVTKDRHMALRFMAMNWSATELKGLNINNQ